MPLSPQDQIRNQIEASENILILAKNKPSGDLVATSWGLFHFLKSQGKNPTLLDCGPQAEKLSFLSRPDQTEKEIKGARDFVLSFNTSRNRIIDFHTENKIDTFDIYITPEKETIDPRDFSFIPAKFKYDLVILLGCQNLDALGEIREKNADLFFEVPAVNIDYSSANENFSQINLVDITASSVAEILTSLVRSNWEKQVSSDVAQCFLAGIISATSNFQNKKTSPQTFLSASWLIEKGANQQEIIRNIFKTQSFPFLKLWGRVMARLNWNEGLKLAWSMISLEDFVQSRTKPDELPLILEKIRDNFSTGKIFVILYSETLSKSIAILKASDLESLKKIQTVCEGELANGHLEIVFEDKNILEAEKELLVKLESQIEK